MTRTGTRKRTRAIGSGTTGSSGTRGTRKRGRRTVRRAKTKRVNLWSGTMWKRKRRRKRYNAYRL